MPIGGYTAGRLRNLSNCMHIKEEVREDRYMQSQYGTCCPACMLQIPLLYRVGGAIHTNAASCCQQLTSNTDM
jgi:hypothetical protein